ncbi:MAG: glutamate--tRNA ligase [candidate division KSB1 bacterium]|nr:glutamate--tRNA ligase [candidate division KSB1 bacterium]MDZ7367319.1 glutamate--tRNA ligase [candidate division KSB1 bacterium]MDZ7405842.1 glutamate--tRNA ligase [candidate division KSB1 bacterium]
MIAVRFAPSPTGYLHIGGARTAIFNWLFAKKHGGKFFLRIEDTDLQRSGEEMTRAILDSLSWLGLDWDGGPVYQSQRFPIYQNQAQWLVRQKKAYHCFCSLEEINAARERAKAAKQNFKYDGRCRKLGPREIEQNLAANKPYAIRFAVQPGGSTSFKDEIREAVSVDNELIDDFVILRSDGVPTYHLAVVVDDHEMGITHVIRGEDHISNTPKQVLLYNAFGWPLPIFAHVPLILGPDKSRLSKRHGATAVGEYAVKGFLPEALFNFLAVLGWSPGDDREILTKEELIRLFDLSGISKSGAVFDEKKLEWMNGRYMSMAPVERLAPLVEKSFIDSGVATAEELQNDREYLLQVLALLKPKVKLIPDFATFGAYFFRDPEQYEEGGRLKHWQDPKTPEYLEKLATRLAALREFSPQKAEEALRQLAGEMGLAASKLIHPARLAISGFGIGPGLFEMMALLGQDRVVRRLQKAVKLLQAN